jgi:hypothetical protein
MAADLREPLKKLKDLLEFLSATLKPVWNRHPTGAVWQKVSSDKPPYSSPSSAMMASSLSKISQVEIMSSRFDFKGENTPMSEVIGSRKNIGIFVDDCWSS